MMHRIVFFLLGSLLWCWPLKAQDSFPLSVRFDSHLDGYPLGSAELSQDVFKIEVQTGTNAIMAADGRILDGGLSPLWEFTDVSAVQKGTIDLETGEIIYTGPASYTISGAWTLTEDQIQELLTGQWQVGARFDNQDYLGQLVPVPEPTACLLFLVGTIAFGWTVRYRRWKNR